MKEKELFVDFKSHQAIYYVEKEDNSYEPIISGSQLSHDYLDDFYYKKNNLEGELREKIINNEISPIYYYMLLQEIGIGDLASRVGVSKRILKKHFKPDYFNKLSLHTLKKYATIFNVNITSFLQLIKDE